MDAVVPLRRDPRAGADSRSRAVIDLESQPLFANGVESTVDFASWLEGPVFEPLKDVEYFKRFFLEAGTVAWPNGADIAPETLYERATSRGAA